MTAPPAKRQKRLVVLSSSPERDDEEASVKDGAGSRNSQEICQSSRQLSLRTRARTRQDTNTSVALGGKKASPKKAPARTKPIRKAASNRSISNFLTTATERQSSIQTESTDVDELEDDIQDGLSGEDTKEGLKDVKAVDETRRRKEDDAGHGQKLLSGTYRGGPSTQEVSTVSLRAPKWKDGRPWVDQYAPTALDEIAVHPKKVDDVRHWMLDTFAGRNRKRLLVLRGASGTGKSTTVTLLARSLDYDILEWRNPVAMESSATGYVSVLAQFHDFVERGARFGGLDMATSVPGAGDVNGPATTSRNKIILMEEFPNTFTSSSDSIQSFRSIVGQFLHSGYESTGRGFLTQGNTSRPTIPMVMVVSETVLASSTSSDQFTAHRLLGPNLLNHPAVTVIDYNPIARTLLTKALQTVIQKEARISGRRTIPGTSALEKIGEVGDIRSAVGALEFMCLRGDATNDWGGKVALSKPKRNVRNSIPMTKLEKESLEVITQREASLGMFHAVGKVVYNKRDEGVPTEADVQSVPQPPTHLSHHVRSKRSPLEVDELMDQTGTDVQTFICTLHENYLPSCYGPTTGDSLEVINGCIDALSDCDLLTPDYSGNYSQGNSKGGGRRGGGTSYSGKISLRQDEISFQTAVRGLLFALPTPVRRQLPLAQGQHGRGRYSGRSGVRDAFKMFYPVSLKLWRQREEREGSLDAWLESSRTGMGIPSHQRISAPEFGVIESWGKKKGSSVSLGGRQGLGASSDAQARGLGLFGIGYSARSELILETLPYLAKILRSKITSRSTDPGRLDELEKFTVMTGLDIQHADDSGDEEEEPKPTLAQVVAKSSRSSAGGDNFQRVGRDIASFDQGKQTMFSTHGAEMAEKLALSEDDIEDE